MNSHGTTVEDIPTFLSQREFEGATFGNVAAVGLDLRDRKFIDCMFENCQLSSVKLDGAVIQSSFKNCKIEGINFFTVKRTLLSLSFESCLIRHSSFAELRLHNAKYARCEFRNVDFADADLTGVDFSSSIFEDCIFRNTNLSKADFRGATGYFIDPIQNKIRGARFSSPDVLNLLAPFDIEIE